MKLNDWLTLSISLAALGISWIFARRQHRIAQRQEVIAGESYNQTEQHYLDQLWQSVLDLSINNERFTDINVTENYQAKMNEAERRQYDVYCYKAWGNVKRIIEAGYGDKDDFQIVVQWMVAFHLPWLDRNPAFFANERFWDAIEVGKSSPAVIHRHRRMPLLPGTLDIDWNAAAPHYHDLLISPFNEMMTKPDRDNDPRNKLIAELRRRINDHRGPDPIEIVDLGCGIGNLLEHVCDLDVHVTGIDISKTSLTIAAATAAKLGVEFTPVVSDLRHLDLKRRFDLVVSVNSILPEHRSDVAPMFDTVARHLRTHGAFVAILPAFEATKHLQDLWHGRFLDTSTESSAKHADRVVMALRSAKLVDDVNRRYADDGNAPQCYHTKEDINAELARINLGIIGDIGRVEYPWELCRQFDYGYFPTVRPEIWDWFVVAEHEPARPRRRPPSQPPGGPPNTTRAPVGPRPAPPADPASSLRLNRR